MSIITSVLYLAGLFALLNDWNASAVLELLLGAASAVGRILGRMLRPVLAYLLPILHHLLLRSLWFQLLSVVCIVFFSWSRAQTVVREMRRQSDAATRQAADVDAIANDLRMRLERSSGSERALEGLSPSELEALEAQVGIRPMLDHYSTMGRHPALVDPHTLTAYV